MPVPKYDMLFNPVLDAMQALGGSASIGELDEQVTRTLGLSQDDIAQMHDERQTELHYRLAWARTYLKAAGYLDNSARGYGFLPTLGSRRLLSILLQ